MFVCICVREVARAREKSPIASAASLLRAVSECWSATSRFALEAIECLFRGVAPGDFQADDIACHMSRSLLLHRLWLGAQPAGVRVADWLVRHASVLGESGLAAAVAVDATVAAF